ncbi:4-hydroxy-tetrahydrodipicolinate reductase [Gulosibacter chungangensis]|uniref:4-hydroxy-tetrahydrodipicolinate reductase n=1 Tax=Gulosibacter chungangensis TaxID=979746 RepID=A0A7J5BCS5_9MICO|nr:4-hydroxy-tetrahydrodipicolinate reductase [Gulosibacter chungangensis]KAB1643621.1 4-hydroxy-tetrahydrodipicolinate reductase [Gulosibacter chungangensis]
MTISVAVAGASGRMGTLIQQIIANSENLKLHAALTSTSSPEEMLGADVLIDVTRIEASEKNVAFALEHGINAVVGTSGWSQERLTGLEQRIPEGRGVIVVPNFSVGSVLGTHLATIAGKFYDSIEILEAHHDKKVDSPSGTAVRTAEAISAARGSEPVPPNADQRSRGEVVAGIPVHALRLRGVVADQQVIFGGTGETLTIRHETFSNTAYTQGIQLALEAATTATGLTVGIDGLLGIGAAA